MARNIGSNNLAEAQRNGSYPVDFVKLVVPTPPGGNPADYTLRLSSLYKDIQVAAPKDTANSWYTGAGHLMSVGRVSESLDVKQNSIDITLSGLDRVVAPVFVNTNFIGSPIILYRGYYNENTGRLAGNPFIIWEGITNNWSTNFSGDLGQANDVAISVSCKNLLVSILETQSGRFTSPVLPANPTAAERYRANFYEHVAYTATFNPSFGKED